jgi:transposase
MGQLVAIDLPGTEQEALRDVVRAREDAVRARHKARQQLKSFMLRHGHIWPGKSSWTRRHHDWIRAQRFESESQRTVLEDYWNEVVHAGERVMQLTSLLEAEASKPTFAKLYQALQALRGISTVISATLVAELGSLMRFAKPGQLMSYVGVTPSEHSSGLRTQRGSITKAGNSHVRHALIEASWCQRLRPAISSRIKKRNAGLPLEIQEIAWKAQHRLHARYRVLTARGKCKQQAVTAIGRELLGFIWAIGVHVESTIDRTKRVAA